MKKKEVFRFFVFYCVLGLFFVVLVFNKYSPRKTIQNTSFLNTGASEQQMKKALENAFKEGYFNGKNSFFAQSKDIPYEYAAFTSKYENLSEDQKKKLEDANQKGYVEGYHKASMESHCPGVD